jgi:hypothetical protein
VGLSLVHLIGWCKARLAQSWAQGRLPNRGLSVLYAITPSYL